MLTRILKIRLNHCTRVWQRDGQNFRSCARGLNRPTLLYKSFTSAVHAHEWTDFSDLDKRPAAVLLQLQNVSFLKSHSGSNVRAQFLTVCKLIINVYGTVSQSDKGDML